VEEDTYVRLLWREAEGGAAAPGGAPPPPVVAKDSGTMFPPPPPPPPPPVPVPVDNEDEVDESEKLPVRAMGDKGVCNGLGALPKRSRKRDRGFSAGLADAIPPPPPPPPLPRALAGDDEGMEIGLLLC
jgi:hypothetical protein